MVISFIMVKDVNLVFIFIYLVLFLFGFFLSKEKKYQLMLYFVYKNVILCSLGKNYLN